MLEICNDLRSYPGYKLKNCLRQIEIKLDRVRGKILSDDWCADPILGVFKCAIKANHIDPNDSSVQKIVRCLFEHIFRCGSDCSEKAPSKEVAWAWGLLSNDAAYVDYHHVNILDDWCEIYRGSSIGCELKMMRAKVHRRQKDVKSLYNDGFDLSKDIELKYYYYFVLIELKRGYFAPLDKIFEMKRHFSESEIVKVVEAFNRNNRRYFSYLYPNEKEFMT